MERTDPKVDEYLAACKYNTAQHCKTFFPDRFWMPFASGVHDKIFELVDGPWQKVAIAAPRGWGKTSVVALGLASRYVMFNLTPFICYINKSHDAASLQTENLRRELVINQNVRKFFGSVKQRAVDTKSEFDEVFSKKAWVGFNTLVWPRGAGQQVRGVLFRNDRPGLIIIDDLEDPEKIENDEIRAKWYQWLYADVIKAVPRLHRNWKIVYIDTLKHEDAVLQKLLDSSEWKSIRLEACDDDFKSVAPEFMSDEDIQREWQEHVDAGQTDVFFRELRNLPISTKDAAFQREYFKYYNLPKERSQRSEDLSITDAEVQMDQHIETVVILDPAKTVKIHSAESAIVGIGIDLRNSRYYIRDIVSKKMYPDEIYDELFGMAIRLNAKVIGIEETSLNEFIKQPIKNEMFKRGDFFELVWLNARGGTKKELRVKELVPFYRLGYIYHNAQCKTITAPTANSLETQLTTFPRPKLWDIMDALAYLIEMLEVGERYMHPQDDLDDPEAEYAELEYEEPLEYQRAI